MFAFRENSFISKRLLERNQEIKGDFAIILLLFLGIIKYVVLFFPRVFKLLYSAIKEDDKSFNKVEKCLVSDPVEGLTKVLDWFFEAKVTASLILFLWAIFIVQFLLVPQKALYFLMSHPDHLTNGFVIWTSITSIFLHADIAHITSNSLALLIFGRFLERHVKGKRLFILFIASGIIANVVSSVLLDVTNREVFSLGASGAIAGIIMFAIVIEPFGVTYLLSGFPLPIFFLGWTLIVSDVTGLTNPSNINRFAHLAGYASIIPLFFVLKCEDRKRSIKGVLINIAMLAVLIYIVNFIL